MVPIGAFAGGSGSLARLTEEEGRHFRVALRGAAGETVYVFDGEGTEWKGSVASVEPAGVAVRLGEQLADRVEPLLTTAVLQAVSRDESFEQAIEAMIPLGVTRIVPLVVERSAVPKPPDAKRLERWRRIAREAAKLSWRRVVPCIDDPLTIPALEERLACIAGESGPAAGGAEAAEVVSLLLDTRAGPGSLSRLLEGPAPRRVLIAVGPEGGFAPAEAERLAGAGFVSVSLGPRILRTRQAGAIALALVLGRWGDLG